MEVNSLQASASNNQTTALTEPVATRLTTQMSHADILTFDVVEHVEADNTMSSPQTQTSCPQCKADQSAYQMMGAQPSFCLQCKFPLVLIANKYPLQQVLSQSGQSTVYLARHHQLKRKAERVIKVLSHEQITSPEAIQRFHREVQVTAELSQLNEHVVRIYDDFGEVPYLGYFYVMEYLEGKMLHEYLKRRSSPLPPAWGLDIMIQLCEAIQTAHENGVIHRDLKPANLMLLERPTAPLFLKVLDWGIAKTNADGTMTQPLTQHAIGTPLYMAPEQVFNNRVDERTDIYAMGILLFELLAGINPFAAIMGQADDEQGQTDHAMAQALNAQLYQQPPRLRDLAPRGQSTPILESIIQRAMAREPEKRYPSVEAFQNELRQAVNSMQFQLPSDSMELLAMDGPQATPHSLDFLPAPGYLDDEEETQQKPPPVLHSLSSYTQTDKDEQTPAAIDVALHSEHMPARTRPLPTPSDRADTIFDGPTLPTADEDVTPGKTQPEPTAQVNLLEEQPEEHTLAITSAQRIQVGSPSRNAAEHTRIEQPGRATLGLINQAYPHKSASLLLWFGCSLLLGALIGLLWWNTKPDETTPTARQTGGPDKRKVAESPRKEPNNPTKPIKKTVRTVWLPPRQTHKQVVEHRTIAAPRKLSASRRKPVLRRAKPRPKTRKRIARRKTYRRRPQPRPAAKRTATTNPCGNGWRWMHVAPYLGHKSEVITEGGKSRRRSQNGICITTSTRRVSIMQQGYALCIFRPTQGTGMLRLKLKPEAGMHSPNYCVRR